MTEVTVYRGEALGAGSRVVGPAIIEHPGTTIVLGNGQTATVDNDLNTVITQNGSAAAPPSP